MAKKLTRVDELISHMHEISSEYVEEGQEKDHPHRMAEVFAAINFISGEMRAYLVEVGFPEEEIDRLEVHYQEEGQVEVHKAVEQLGELN